MVLFSSRSEINDVFDTFGEASSAASESQGAPAVPFSVPAPSQEHLETFETTHCLEEPEIEEREERVVPVEVSNLIFTFCTS